MVEPGSPHAAHPIRPVLLQELLSVLGCMERRHQIRRDRPRTPEFRHDRLEPHGTLEGQGREDGPSEIAPDHQHTMVAQENRPVRPKRLSHRSTGLRCHHQIRRAIEHRQAFGEHQRVVGKVLEAATGCGQRRRVERMRVYDSAHVSTSPVHLEVQRRLEMHGAVPCDLSAVEIERDDVARRHLFEPQPFAFHQHAVALPRADVAQRQIAMAVERENPAGPGDLVLQRRDCTAHTVSDRALRVASSRRIRRCTRAGI